MFSHIESIPDILALQPCVSGIYPTEPAVMTRQPIAILKHRLIIESISYEISKGWFVFVKTINP